MNEKNIALLCTGRLSHHDQGISFYVGKYIESNYSFTPSIDIINADVEGMSLLNIFMEYEEVIILDAIGVDDTPGSIYHFPAREFRNLSSDGNMDDTNPLGCLNILEARGELLPVVSLLAIVPDNIDAGVGLSPILKHSVEAYALNIVKTVEKQGVSYEVHDKKRTIDEIISSFTSSISL